MNVDISRLVRHPFESIIVSYVHQDRIGVLVEVGAQTDFATRSAEFRSLAHDIALHIAACAPPNVDELLAQPFVKEPEVTVGDLVARLASALRETIVVIRFARMDVGDAPTAGTSPPRAPAVARRA